MPRKKNTELPVPGKEPAKAVQKTPSKRSAAGRKPATAKTAGARKTTSPLRAVKTSAKVIAELTEQPVGLNGQEGPPAVEPKPEKKKAAGGGKLRKRIKALRGQIKDLKDKVKRARKKGKKKKAEKLAEALHLVKAERKDLKQTYAAIKAEEGTK